MATACLTSRYVLTRRCLNGVLSTPIVHSHFFAPLQKRVSMRVSPFQMVRYFSGANLLLIDPLLMSGTLVIGNIWSANSGCDLDSSCCRAIFRDPAIYPEPEVFKPERFINPDGRLRDDLLLLSAFGYGKRIYPGTWALRRYDAVYLRHLSALAFPHRDSARWSGKVFGIQIYSLIRQVTPPLFVRKRGNKSDGFLAIRNRSHALSLPGMKGPRSLLLQIPWRVEFFGQVPFPAQNVRYSPESSWLLRRNIHPISSCVRIFEPLLIHLALILKTSALALEFEYHCLLSLSDEWTS